MLISLVILLLKISYILRENSHCSLRYFAVFQNFPQAEGTLKMIVY